MSEAAPKPLGPNGTGMLVAGVDGCRGGWVCVTARIEDSSLRIETCSVAARFDLLIEATRKCAAVAVDIPIGLSEEGRRQADFEARRCIGPRRSSVFPAPARCLVTAAGSYGELNALSNRVCGRGISRQTCNILPKIVEADACMTPALQQRIVEAHPEVGFWSLNGCVHLEHAKLRPEGLAQRLGLLETVYGASVSEMLVPRGASRDDFYDAAVLARTAARLVTGDAVRLPAEPQLDARGLRMEIVY